MTALWVYKCRKGRLGEDGIEYGDWNRLFDHGRMDWGTTREIKSAQSRKLIREDMRQGDLVLAWQTDRQEAVGICRVHDITRIGHPDGTSEHIVVLDPEQRFDPPVKLLELKRSDAALASVAAFGRVVPATVYSTTPDEARILLDRCGMDDEAVLDD